MRIVPADKFTLLTSNISPQDYDEWDNAIAYPKDSKVTIAADGKNYYATKDIAAGVKPAPEDEEGNETGWFPESNNQMMMFDYNNFNQTENDESIDFSYRALNIDTISFLNVQAKEIYIKMTDFETGFLVYEKTIALETNEVHPYNYFFVEPNLKDRLTLRLQGTELENKVSELIDTLTTQQIVDRYTVTPPLFFNAKVEISIRNPGQRAKIGSFVSGTSLDLGVSLWNGAQIKKKRFGLRTQTPWGTYKLKQGQITNLISVPVLIENENLPYVSNILNRYAFQYCLFVGDESQGIPSLTGFGIAEDEIFNLSPEKSTYTLKIGSIL